MDASVARDNSAAMLLLRHHRTADNPSSLPREMK